MNRLAPGHFRRLRCTRRGVREADLHFAEEPLERVDAGRHPGDQGELGAVGSGRLARGVELQLVSLARHQRSEFFPEARQADRILGQREIVVRAIADPLIRVPGVSGATDLGDGRAVLILDTAAIARLARRSASGPAPRAKEIA